MNKNKISIDPWILLLILFLSHMAFLFTGVYIGDNTVDPEPMNEMTLDEFINGTSEIMRSQIGITVQKEYQLKWAINGSEGVQKVIVDFTFIETPKFEIDIIMNVTHDMSSPEVISFLIDWMIDGFYASNIMEIQFYSGDITYQIRGETLYWNFFDGYPAGDAGKGTFNFGEPFMSYTLIYSGDPSVHYLELKEI